MFTYLIDFQWEEFKYHDLYGTIFFRMVSLVCSKKGERKLCDLHTCS
jgi:hypothetical protein